MGSSSSCFVELQICNNTQNITLKEPRTYFKCGHCSVSHGQELSPGSSGTWHISGDPKLWGMAGTTDVSGILVYEAKSFTLAIYCYNPTDYSQSSMRLGLELSPAKAHLLNLEAAYHRMDHGTYSSSCQDIKFTRVIVGKGLGTARVSHGPIHVVAAMFNNTSSTIKVVLEEEKGLG